jgi:trehalose 6-phosphate synthase
MGEVYHRSDGKGAGGSRMIWTRSDLEKLVRELFADHHFLVVSNREPFEHIRAKSKIEVRRPPGGVVTGINPVMEAAGGTWISVASGNADREVVDRQGRVKVPPGKESYTLRRVWLTEEETDGYYYGFSNEAIWPLCHVAYQRPTFTTEGWECYVKVNRKLADAVLEETGDDPAVVFVQDYHLALLPRFIKEERPDIRIAHFWHIPWPNHEAFRICPQRRQIVEGLLGSDIIGFHIRHYCNNFLYTVDNTVEARTDRERTSIFYGGHETLVRSFPISVDFDGLAASVQDEGPGDRERLRREFHIRGRLVLSVDRIDYTKGIPERIYAIDRFLEENPRWIGKVTFLQVGALSRVRIPAYKLLNDEINSLIEEVNGKYGEESWKPIVPTRRHVPYEEILTLYRMAGVVVVSSLHDGMNLVAKEFVACRGDEDGVLVISRFTGAARELEGALLINPYDRGNFAESIAEALLMPRARRRRRMRKMREKVRDNNIFRWAGKILQELARV